MVAVMVVDGVGGVLVAVVFVGGVYVLCWLLCCVVVNPHKSHSYFRFSGLPVRPQVFLFLFSMPQFAPGLPVCLKATG